MARAALASLCLLPLAGCALFRKYDVARIHQGAAGQPRNPVIFIHGFIGAKLKNSRTGQPVWGSLRNAVFHAGADDLALPIDRLPITDNRDDLEAYELYESVAGVKFYGAMIDALTGVGRYTMGDIDDPRPGDNAFVYAYDWRRDNVESAQGLGRAIDRLRAGMGRPQQRFDIIAHSMGGMVAEYYLKYGTADVVSDGKEHPVTWAGAPQIGRLALIGTPQRGTMSAFRILNAGFSRTMCPRVVFTMPSVYQLLPSPGGTHFVDPGGAPLDVDLYDAQTWVRNGWSVFNPRYCHGAAPSDAEQTARARFVEAALDRALKLHAALERDGGPSPVPVHLFGSDCIPTLDRVVLKPTSTGTLTVLNGDGRPAPDGRTLDEIMMAPGDGTVTADSLLGQAVTDSGPIPDAQPVADRQTAGGARASSHEPATPVRSRADSAFFFCGVHGFLVADRGFQDNLFRILLAPDAGVAATLEPTGRGLPARSDALARPAVAADR